MEVGESCAELRKDVVGSVSYFLLPLGEQRLWDGELKSNRIVVLRGRL